SSPEVNFDITDVIPSEFDDIADTFINIPVKNYPLIITFQKFLLMLDGTLESSFFERFRKASEDCHAAVFHRSSEFALSDSHDFWTEASLYLKEGFDHWDLDFEAWKFCFLPGQIASCLVIFFLSCSLFVAIYLDIDSKIMMIVVCL
ncbi:hypothetical protein Tco_1307688, partial [Tanacetum coccineum]